MTNILNNNPISEEVFFQYLPITLTIIVLILYLSYAFYYTISQFYKSYINSNQNNHVFGLNTTNARHPKWKTISLNYRKKMGKCAVCGKTTNLVVHHKMPFHMNPDKELDENNFVVLCENRPVNCHYLFGHLMNWQGYNQNIDEDIQTWNKKLETA